MDYKDKICPYCEKAFNENDDIVVCPDCGTPMHRDCYFEHGECFNKDKHDEDYDYLKSDEYNESISKEDENYECSNCGYINEKGTFFCKKCGNPLLNDPKEQINDAYKKTQGNPMPGFNGTPFNNQEMPKNGPFLAVDFSDPLGGIDKDAKLTDNITVDEMAKYVKKTTPYYIRVFYNIVNFGKSKFNFGAAIFSGAYFLYRKMYWLGAIFCFIEGAMLLLSQYINYVVMQTPTYVTITAKLEKLVTSSNYTPETALQFMNSLTFEQGFVLFLPTILLFCNLIIMIAVGFTANKLYFKHCVKQINKIKESNNEVEINNKLSSKGGVNIALGISLFAAYVIINYLPSFLIFK